MTANDNLEMVMAYI